METLEKSKKVYTYNMNDLEDIVYETIEIIDEYVNKNDYVVLGNKFDDYLYESCSDKILSKNTMKKIQRYCFLIKKRPTLNRINLFFRLMPKLYNNYSTVVNKSLKEKKIQELRRAWLKSKNETEMLLKKYKEEKGDFYKKNFFN